MPGDLVVFADAPEATRLIHALADLRDNAEFDFVLIGGLAVAARLRSYHRATQDLDALTSLDRREFEHLAIETISGARMQQGHLLVAGVQVDVIDIDPTVPYPQIRDLPDPADRLFNAAHLFAHADATLLTVRSGADETTVLVASARSLLITKLHGYVNPRRDTRKHGSDALDIYELGRHLVAVDAAVRPYGSPQIPPLVREVAQWGVDHIRRRPIEMTRRLATIGVTAAVTEISALAELLYVDLGGPTSN